jgi:uncharacterized phage-associated protein
MSNLTIFRLVLKFIHKGKNRGVKMESITFEFDQTKAIETILYLARRISGADIYGICKLLYLSDKVSLEKYGRFVFGESYCAMKEGATPSYTYDLLKGISQSPTNELRVDGVKIVALREANSDYFSKSDLECLDLIINKYGNVSNSVRAKDAHDEAWKKAWGKRGTKGSVSIPIASIAEQLSDSDDLISYLCNSDVR